PSLYLCHRSLLVLSTALLRAPRSTLFPYTTLFRSASTAPPKSTIGQIARGLERRAFSGDPVTILSCDNLQSAGDVTESVVTEYRSEEHTSELQSRFDIVCRLLLEKKQ